MTGDTNRPPGERWRIGDRLDLPHHPVSAYLSRRPDEPIVVVLRVGPVPGICQAAELPLLVAEDLAHGVRRLADDSDAEDVDVSTADVNVNAWSTPGELGRHRAGWVTMSVTAGTLSSSVDLPEVAVHELADVIGGLVAQARWVETGRTP